MIGMDDGVERTLPASPRRREEARRRGAVARSADLVSAGTLLAAATAFAFLGAGLSDRAAVLVRGSLSSLAAAEPGTLPGLFEQATLGAGLTILPLIGVFLVAALLLNLLQTGFVFRPLSFGIAARPAAPGRATVRTAGALLKFAVVAGLTALTLASEAGALGSASGAAAIGGSAARTAWLVAVRCGLALLVLSIADYAWQRWSFERDLRMTPADVREEARAAEGDPALRRERRNRGRVNAEKAA